jgi:hypothetical protein
MENKFDNPAPYQWEFGSTALEGMMANISNFDE